MSVMFQKDTIGLRDLSEILYMLTGVKVTELVFSNTCLKISCSIFRGKNSGDMSTFEPGLDIKTRSQGIFSNAKIQNAKMYHWTVCLSRRKSQVPLQS